MATTTKPVAEKDAYLETITAEIKEIDKQIEAALPKKLLDRKAELETIKKHRQQFLKEAGKK